MSRYVPAKIEKKWQQRWFKEKVYEPDLLRSKKPSSAKASTVANAMVDKSVGKPFYNLMMFPYPSAEGLHVGNMYAFVGSDIYGRLKRMQGYDVFEPIGLDGFGIHSENYAIKIGAHPVSQAKKSEKNFYRQFALLGNGFAWSERLETYDPTYYRWTQWIFVRMFKHGLAYRKKSAVNWCPSCLTVLADEQVIAGACERCGNMVIKKELEQWFFGITKYAARLLANLEKIDWSGNVKTAQKNWIGRSEGVLIPFSIKHSVIPSVSEESRSRNGIPHSVQDDKTQESIEVFTTRPDTLFGATYLVLAPEHELVFRLRDQIQNIKEVEEYQKKTSLMAEIDRIAEGKEKTGVELKGIRVINPANNEEIPVWVSDYVLGGVGTGAIMAVPAHDQRDFDFAKKFNLPIRMVVCPHYPAPTCPVLDAAYTGDGHLVDSGAFNGMPALDAKWAITKAVKGKRKSNYRLRDWLISRQRYWGPPIPMIFCDNCSKTGKGERKDMPGWYAVAEKNLPVKLPFIKNFRPTGTDKSPLASVQSFYKVRCPNCTQWARRETDVSDNFLDSAWYYLRYPSVNEDRRAWNPAITKKWFPVDMYIGGAEHSVLHLLYVRFLALVFHDWKMINFDEPFTKFRSHGLIIKDGAKMSKSRGNVVNPDEYIEAYGADVLRMYLMFLGSFNQGGDFRDAGIAGITRFLERVWNLVSGRAALASQKNKSKNEKREALDRTLNKTIKKVGEDIESLQYNTAISALMILLNEFEEKAEMVSRNDCAIFLKLLAPFAPHITEELWHGRDFSQSKKWQSVHREPWPAYDKKWLHEETHEFAIQVNGKLRDTFMAAADVTEKEAVRLTLAREKVKILLAGREPKKVIFVPGRLVNVVV